MTLLSGTLSAPAVMSAVYSKLTVFGFLVSLAVTGFKPSRLFAWIVRLGF